jgi:hypothetical protein
LLSGQFWRRQRQELKGARGSGLGRAAHRAVSVSRNRSSKLIILAHNLVSRPSVLPARLASWPAGGELQARERGTAREMTASQKRAHRRSLACHLTLEDHFKLPLNVTRPRLAGDHHPAGRLAPLSGSNGARPAHRRAPIRSAKKSRPAASRLGRVFRIKLDYHLSPAHILSGAGGWPRPAFSFRFQSSATACCPIRFAAVVVDDRSFAGASSCSRPTGHRRLR